jgi:hypothetical protein
MEESKKESNNKFIEDEVETLLYSYNKKHYPDNYIFQNLSYLSIPYFRETYPKKYDIFYKNFFKLCKNKTKMVESIDKLFKKSVYFANTFLLNMYKIPELMNEGLEELIYGKNDSIIFTALIFEWVNRNNNINNNFAPLTRNDLPVYLAIYDRFKTVGFIPSYDEFFNSIESDIFNEENEAKKQKRTNIGTRLNNFLNPKNQKYLAEEGKDDEVEYFLNPLNYNEEEKEDKKHRGGKRKTPKKSPKKTKTRKYKR